MVYIVNPAGSPDVRIFPDIDALSRAIAGSVFELLSQAAIPGQENGRMSVALAGGNTPRLLYQRLSSDYGKRIPWEKIDLFWGDERFVAPDDPQSNYRMARESLIDSIAIPSENVHPVRTDLPSADQAASSYETLMRSLFSSPWPRFDLVLLGLGGDGHTASLFPGSAALEESERWVTSSESPIAPKDRITFTLPVLNHSARIYFLVSGADKARALSRILEASEANGLPAYRVRPMDGTVTWWADTAAASLWNPNQN